MTRWVLLRHTPDVGPAHLDLMLEAEGDEEHRLVTFRLPLQTTIAAGQVIAGQRLADHRAMYLDFEGEISGGRGCVARTAHGPCRGVAVQSGHVEARICVNGAWLRLSGGADASGAWRLEFRPCEPES
ncbi:MAG: hypothetical protein IT439_05920 [Phycisphaerales bacterium]|nr:hypothetical protein [Phycisphaerales bacterium]